MMKRLTRLLLWLALVSPALVAPAMAQDGPPKLTAEQSAFATRMKAILDSQKRQTGDIPIPAARATLRLGKDYYFLGPDDARRVIVEAWGNPADEAQGILGMVFPANQTFLDRDSWGAVITYEATGYVKDDDAASTDFDALMTDMKSGEEERNKARVEAGYSGIHLVGWAERPSYDRAHHSVIWARDLQFAGTADHSLNYDVRLLGRVGVLSLNMIAGMPQLPEIKVAAAKFASSASFDTGATYADFDPNVDKVAEYGIGGLVAAGVGLAVAKKLGFLAIALGFGKKLIFLVVLVFGVAWRWIKRLFGVRDTAEEAYFTEEPAAAPNEAEAGGEVGTLPTDEQPRTT